jgi:hypothetical protein
VESHARARLLASPGRASAIRRVGLRNPSSSRSCTQERANKVFGKRLHANARDLLTSSTLLISLLRHRRPC